MTRPLRIVPFVNTGTDEQKQAESAPFDPAERFRLACAMLRKAGKLDHGRPDGQPRLPGQKGKESALEWLVRLGLAPNPQTAAEMLILANGLQHVLDELTGSKFRPDPQNG